MVEETSDVMMVVGAGFFGVVGNLQTGSHAPSEPVSIRPCLYPNNRCNQTYSNSSWPWICFTGCVGWWASREIFRMHERKNRWKFLHRHKGRWVCRQSAKISPIDGKKHHAIETAPLSDTAKPYTLDYTLEKTGHRVASVYTRSKNRPPCIHADTRWFFFCFSIYAVDVQRYYLYAAGISYCTRYSFYMYTLNFSLTFPDLTHSNPPDWRIW